MRIGQIEVEINIVFLAFGIMTKDWNLTFDITSLTISEYFQTLAFET